MIFLQKKTNGNMITLLNVTLAGKADLSKEMINYKRLGIIAILLENSEELQMEIAIWIIKHRSLFL